jgi:hypothetical protein
VLPPSLLIWVESPEGESTSNAMTDKDASPVAWRPVGLAEKTQVADRPTGSPSPGDAHLTKEPNALA